MSDVSRPIDFNSTGNFSGGSTTTKTNLEVRIVTLTFYVLTFLVGLSGNTLVIYVIGRYGRIRMRSVSNYYIWNLAFADELFVLTIPFFCVGTYYNDWIFGRWTCKLASVFRECNKFSSLLTLMALSVDRYLATFPAMGRYRQVRFGPAVCTGIWIVCLGLSLPYWMFSTTVVARGRSSRTGTTVRHSCKFQWPRPHYHEVWACVQLFGAVLVPFTVIAVFNVLLVRRLNRRTSSASAIRLHGSSRRRLRRTGVSSRRQRLSSGMTRTVLVIVVTFAVCQLPLVVYEFVSVHIVRQMSRGLMTLTVDAMNRLIYCHMAAQTLVFVSSCCNPFIYGVSNGNFRKLYLQALCCVRTDGIGLQRGGIATVGTSRASTAFRP